MTANLLPYHGLWKAGAVALPNGTTRPFPSPHSGDTVPSDFGSAQVLRRPGWSAPARSTAEAAADAVAGRQWLDHALLSGSYRSIGGQRLRGYVYVDPAGKRWRVQTVSTHQPRAPGNLQPDTCSIAVTLTRFGHFDGKNHSSVVLSAQAPSGVALPPTTVWGPGDGTADLICAKSDGSEAIFGRFVTPSFWWGAGQLWPLLFWRLSISGTGDEALPNFGLAIAWSVIVDESNWKFTNTTAEDNLYPQYTTVTSVKTDVGGLKRVDATLSGGTMADKTTVRTSRQHVKLWPAYTAADGLMWLESDYTWAETVRAIKTYNVTDGTAHLYDLGAGNYDQDPFVHQEITTTTITASATMTLSYGGTTIYSHTRNDAPAPVVIDTGPIVGYMSLTILGDPPTGLPMGTTTTHGDLGDDEHTSTSVVSPFGQATAGWGIGYPWAFGEPVSGAYRTTVAVRYSNQVVGLIELDVPAANATGPVSRQQLVDAWAPGGAHAAFSTTAPLAYPATAHAVGAGWAGRFASWHPVTDVLAVDTVPICWV